MILVTSIIGMIFSQGNGSLSSNGDMETQLCLELQKKTDEYDQQKQDYEDLLVLLEDQDTRIKKLKVGRASFFSSVNTILYTPCLVSRSIKSNFFISIFSISEKCFFMKASDFTSNITRI